MGVRAEWIGRGVRCPRCGKSFSVAGVKSAGSTPLENSALPTQDAGETSPRSTSSVKTTPQALGRFELQEILGQGAFGRVYRAYDPQLDRFVALKVPTFADDDDRRVQRFIAEAKAAARLRHPNIVPTYESGRIGGQYYIAAQFVAGAPLSKRIRDNPPELRQAVDWVRQLAQGLAYAHGEGIVHRDIKPDNIMLDQKGVPQLMDFGLARRIDEASTMTTDGSIMGTPAYMSPEQARGESARIGPLSDQFSLGVVLYELLAGRRPFEGSSHAVLNLVTTTEPPTLRSLRPELPRDLVAICQKAMEKEPERRYPDAQAFEADLTRWLDGAPVSARVSRPWERAIKWSKRNPTIAALAAGILLIFILAFAGITAALGEAIASRRHAINERNAAQTARDSARRLAEDLERQRAELKTSLENLRAATNLADTKTAEAGRLDAQLQATRASIDAAEKRVRAAEEAERKAGERAAESNAQSEAALAKVAQETERAQRTLAASYFEIGNRRCQDGLTAEGGLWLARALETLPSGELNSAKRYRQALQQYLAPTVVELPTPELKFSLEHNAEITAADFHPSDSLAVAGDRDGKLHLWDTESGKRLQTVTAHEKAIRVVAFGPVEVGGLVLTASDDETAAVWKISQERLLESQPPKMRQQFPTTSAAWSSNGRWILTGSDQARHMQLWSANTRRASGNPFGEENVGRVYSFALHAGDPTKTNELFAVVGTGHLKRGLALWDAIQGKPVAKEPLLLTGDVRATAIDVSGKRLAAATTDKRLWFASLASWEIDGKWFDCPGRPLAIAWSPVQPYVLVGGDDRSAVLVDAGERKQIGERLPHTGAVNAVRFHPAGNEFLTGDASGVVRIWKMPRRQQRLTIRAGGEITALALSPDGRRIVAATGRDLTAWAAENGQVLATVRDRTAVTRSLAFAPNGQTFVVGDDRTARVWNAQTWKPLGVEMPHEGQVSAVGYRRDGKFLFSASADKTARVWDAKSWKPVCDSLPHPERVTSAVFTADETGLITGCEDHCVRLWNWSRPAKPQRVFTAPAPVRSIALSDDSKTLAAGCENGEVLTWNVNTGELQVSLPALAGRATHVSFIPGAETLVTGSSAGMDLWDLTAKQRIAITVKTGGQTTHLSSDREGLGWTGAVEGDEGAVAVWGIPPPLRTNVKWLSEWVKVHTGRQLSETGVVQTLSAAELQAAKKRLAELSGEP